MGLNTAVLRTETPSLPLASSGALSISSPAFAELAVNLFGSESRRRVVAFVSVHRGEGVTATIRGLLYDLTLSGKIAATVPGTLHNVQAFGLRDRRDTILLLDCPPLQDSGETLHIAPACDAVVLVVEAGRTTRPELAQAIHVLKKAGANVLGSVLNKRRYPIPNWLDRVL